MPRHVGKKWRAVAEAAERERTATAAIQTAEVSQVRKLADQIRQARIDKQSAREMAEDEFVCAWHRDEFKGRARIVFEVTAVLEVDEEGETVREERFRAPEAPVYLVACRGCGERLGLVEHLLE